MTGSPLGQPCTIGSTCASGVCAQGRCCDRGCTGACESCAQAGREGQCTVVPEGTTSSCAPFVCDGQSTCPTTCTSARQCGAGTFCDQGSCRATRPNGQMCSAAFQCTSGICANGVCCGTACSGSCDRCDLSASPGTCRPAPMGDLGEPLCGGSVTCDGTNVDCPIACSSGCPMNTYCSGTLCAAKKPDGTGCAMGVECITGNCVDGVCCNSTCGNGANDCQVCNLTGSVGTCTISGNTVECRPSTGTCDAPERCDGIAGACPADLLAARNGTDCGSTTAWSGSCAPGSGTCPTTGTEGGTLTPRSCLNNACIAGTNQAASRSCAYNPNGRDCGTTMMTGACTQSSAGCSTAGTQMVTTTSRTCNGSGQCVTASPMTMTQGCTFNPSGTACGTNTVWSGTCTQTGSGCSTTGTEAGTIQASTCNASGQCVVTSSTATSRACAFNPSGAACGTNTVWSGSCVQSGGGCSTAGNEAGSIQTSTCTSAGQCMVTGTTATSRACTFNPTGVVCGTNTVWGGTCVQVGGGCATTGSEAGTITTSTCNSGGACIAGGPAATSRSCSYNPNGLPCGTNTVWSGTCVPPGSQPCSLSGTEAGTITASTCNASGSCVAGGPTATSRSCSRDPSGTSCGISCINCFGSNDACGDLYERVCNATGSCILGSSLMDICQCPGSMLICPL